MLKKLKAHTHIFHKTGLFLSLLCLVHCLAMPFIITFLPFVSKDLISHQSEIILISLSLILGVILLTKDYQIHKNPKPLIMLCLAGLIQLLAWTVFPASAETFWVVLGSFILAAAYILNWQSHRKVCTNHNH